MSADDLLSLGREAAQVLTAITAPCEDGRRACPTGCEACSQAVYRCRRCGVHDYGDDKDGPGMRDCKRICGESLTGWHRWPSYYAPWVGGWR